MSCGSNPIINVEIPNGLTPPDWVYFWQQKLEHADAGVAKRCHLLDGSDMPGNVFDGDGVLDCETVALTFYPRFVDEDASIGGETWGDS